MAFIQVAIYRAAAEPAEKGLSDVRQIGRAKVHACCGNVDTLRLEGAVRVDLAAELDNRFEWDALGFCVAAVFLRAHRFPPTLCG